MVEPMSLQPPRPNFTSPLGGEGEPLLGPPSILRIGLLAFSGVLALGGALMLVCALLLPQAIALPLDRDSALAAANLRWRAVAAARLGAVRGDLFAQAAYSDAGLLWLRDRTVLTPKSPPPFRRQERTLRRLWRWLPSTARSGFF